MIECPTVTRVVRIAIAADITANDGRYPSSLKWCSVSQIVSKPASSIATMCSIVSS